MSTEADYKALYEQSQATNAGLQIQLLQLTQQLAQLQKMIFGSKQERFIPADPSSPQLSLDIQSEPVATSMITSSKPVSYIRHTVSGTCNLIAPLFEALKAEVLQSNYLHADETPIKVMDKDKKGETHRGYYWVYQNSLDKIVLFDYREGRGREGPTDILQGFQGYLQTDGYVGYDVFARQQGVTLIHCMAHARRKFNDALNNDEARASYAMQRIQQLYAIERNCKEQQYNFAETRDVRQRDAVPILTELGSWLREQYVQVLPKSLIGEAIAYSLQRWERLSAYASDGRLNIDNNPVENSIRPVALGRKNYLFAGSHEAAKRSAMLYSLLGTAKMHAIEPYTWLKNVLQRIADHPVNKVAELLPHRYKK